MHCTVREKETKNTFKERERVKRIKKKIKKKYMQKVKVQKETKRSGNTKETKRRKRKRIGNKTIYTSYKKMKGKNKELDAYSEKERKRETSKNRTLRKIN